MSDQTDRDKRILSKLNLDKLPFKISSKNFFIIWEKMFQNLKPLFIYKEGEYALKWCLSTNKRMRVFLIIFEANEEGYEVYKESVASNLPKFSYKTVAKIIDDGMKKGYYLNLPPRTVTSTHLSRGLHRICHRRPYEHADPHQAGFSNSVRI